MSKIAYWGGGAVIPSPSGLFPSGVMLAATDQPTSGFLLQVDSSGVLTTQGPFAI